MNHPGLGFLVAVLSVGTAACARETPAGAINIELATTRWIGSADSTDWFARLQHGRFSPTGETYLLDARAPFVRRYDASGQLKAIFLGEGGGPGESRLPVGLAILPGERVVVADGSRLQMFDSTGHYLSEVTIAQGIVDLTRGCASDLLVYGPGPATNGSTWGWLTAFPAPDSIHTAQARVLLHDTLASALRGFGKRTLASDGHTLALFDEYSSPRRLLLFDCTRPDDPPRVIPALADAEDSREPGESGARTQLSAGARVFGGVAVAGAQVVWIWMTLPERMAPGATGLQEIYVSDGTDARLFAVTAAPVALLDGLGDRLLFSALEDVPRAREVSMRRLIAVLPGS